MQIIRERKMAYSIFKEIIIVGTSNNDAHIIQIQNLYDFKDPTIKIAQYMRKRVFSILNYVLKISLRKHSQQQLYYIA